MLFDLAVFGRTQGAFVYTHDDGTTETIATGGGSCGSASHGPASHLDPPCYISLSFLRTECSKVRLDDSTAHDQARPPRRTSSPRATRAAT
jgi:hypothetical protein